MEIKTLAREQMLAEIIAERGGMVLDLTQQVIELQSEVKILKAEKEDLMSGKGKKKPEEK